MPRGPKGERLPADNGPSSAGEGKNPAAVTLGRMGGKARAEGLSARRRKEIARKAAMTRWANK